MIGLSHSENVFKIIFDTAFLQISVINKGSFFGYKPLQEGLVGLEILQQFTFSEKIANFC